MNNNFMDHPNTQIQMIADYDGDISGMLNTDFSGVMPILTTRNIVMFPGAVCPILIGRTQSLRLVKDMERHTNTVFAVACQKSVDAESPTMDDLYHTAVFAKLLRLIDMNANGQYTAIIQALGRCELRSVVREEPYLVGEVQAVPEVLPENDAEFSTAVQKLRHDMEEYIHKNEQFPDESIFAISNINNEVLTVNYIATNLPIAIAEKIQLLNCAGVKERLFSLLGILNREIQFMDLKLNIENKTQQDIDEQQREYFLHQQMRTIREELGDAEGSPDKKNIKQKADKKKWNDEVKEFFTKEFEKLDNFNPQSPEYQIQLNYLQTLVSLPWNEKTKDKLDLNHASNVLNSNHFGMEKVKERIIEFLAVMKLRADAMSSKEPATQKSQIICLVGPPGVGKTSLGKSVASAINRKYARISLGGMHDESEIRGHRKTYIGAMPGRIIKALQKVGSSNPVFILDEIDKVTQSTYNGDPMSALLEVLDPEQNVAFHDNFLDIDYDLSDVLFICTANDLSTLPRPLLDRMEIIELSGYTTEEKYEIAKRHLVKRDKQEVGLNAEQNNDIKFEKKAVIKVIEQYTRESGVRQLDRQINKILRKLAVKIVCKNLERPFTLTEDKVEELLGKPIVSHDTYKTNKYAGVVTGLAWTAVGGEILFIETSLSKGKAAKLTLTGNLGDVMKESAALALEYCKAHADTLGIDYRIFDNYNIHIHVPEGATPKDGPSAGITIATSIASALTQRKVRKNTAMTGEITLTGRVLPVGGIKEKILAAKRAGITDILLCKENRKDIEEIPETYIKNMSFHYVENVNDVWDFALTDEKVENPVRFVFDTEVKKTEA